MHEIPPESAVQLFLTVVTDALNGKSVISLFMFQTLSAYQFHLDFAYGKILEKKSKVKAKDVCFILLMCNGYV